MNVGIIGGTGGMGKGFAIRWCKDHNVVIGSRNAERQVHQLKNIQNWQKRHTDKLTEILQVQITHQLQNRQMF